MTNNAGAGKERAGKEEREKEEEEKEEQDGIKISSENSRNPLQEMPEING